jgi:hypothetical protein
MTARGVPKNLGATLKLCGVAVNNTVGQHSESHDDSEMPQLMANSYSSMLTNQRHVESGPVSAVPTLATLVFRQTCCSVFRDLTKWTTGLLLIPASLELPQHLPPESFVNHHVQAPDPEVQPETLEGGSNS